MNGYEITVSVTALCPCCGKDLPSNSYLTDSKPLNHPFDRDNPYERKDRRVFINPCSDCFTPSLVTAELLEALKITRGNIASLGPAGALTPYTSYQEWLAMVDAAIAKATGGQNEQD